MSVPAGYAAEPGEAGHRNRPGVRFRVDIRM